MEPKVFPILTIVLDKEWDRSFGNIATLLFGCLAVALYGQVTAIYGDII